MVATVSVLFTDLVGSTALLSRVGEDRAEDLRREHFALLRDAVATGGGREVKNLGDGLMVVVPSAADAVAIAVGIQQRFHLRNAGAGEPLLVKIGVALGDADVDGSDYFGTPVVEAARLCAHASGGEVLVTEIVRVLSGSRGGFCFEPVGSLELKGLDAPVSTHRVAWQPLEAPEATRVPLPARLEAADTSVFIGREREREALGRALKDADAGGRRVVLIGGEPGIGKTTLASAFATEAFAAGATVLYGRCDEDLGIPYRPWAEALTHLVRHIPDELVDQHVASRGEGLGRLVPVIAARSSAKAVPIDAESERYLLFGAVADLLARASAIGPIVLVLDDLHWADRTTIQLLRHISGTDEDLRVVIVGTFRDSEVTSTHPLADALAALHREPHVTRLALRGLGDDELLALLQSMAGHTMTGEGVELRDALLAETEGNPFFVREMLRHLADSGAIYQDPSGLWTSGHDLRESGLPVSIREVVGRRIAALGGETHRLLSLASVIGRDFDVDMLAQIGDIDEDAVLDVCDTAVRAAVLHEGAGASSYTFAHALIQHTLYDEMSSGRRARTHRRVAEALEEICGPDPGARVGELAYHWSRATRPEDASKAIVYARRAGDRALSQLAPDEALRWYESALDLTDRTASSDVSHRAELLFGIGVAQLQTGNAAHRETLLAAAGIADETGDIGLLVRAALANTSGWGSTVGGVDVDRVGIIERALERLGDGDSPERARLLAQLCAESRYTLEFDDRVKLADEAIEVARRAGDQSALAYALLITDDSTTAPSTLDIRRERIAEAAALASSLADPGAHYHTHNYRRCVAFESGDRDTIDQSTEAAGAVVFRLRQPTLVWNELCQWAWIESLNGDLDAAETAATTALEAAPEAEAANAFHFYSAQLMSIRWMQGRWGEVVSLVAEAAQVEPLVPGFRAGYANALAYTDPATARLVLDQEFDDGYPARLDLVWLSCHTLWADAVSLTKHHESAALLHERLLPWREQFSTTRVTAQGSVSHLLGALEHLLERYDDADASFAVALTVHERMRAPFFVAWTQLEWALMLLDRNADGDLQRATDMLEETLDVASLRGYGDIQRRAHAALRGIGTSTANDAPHDQRGVEDALAGDSD